MAIQTTRYIRKPLYVDAIRVTNTNFLEVAKWCGGDIITDKEMDQQYIRVRVTNPKTPRQTRAFVGDWLLYTDRGYKVYTTKAFRNSFDEVEEESVVHPDQEVLSVGNDAIVVPSSYGEVDE